MTIAGFSRHGIKLTFGLRQWAAMVRELGKRGAGQSESGAFLLSDRHGHPTRVRRIVYLDDLDPNCLQGSIRFDGRAYSPLWEICEREKRKVLADVHTHPHGWVGQSPTDMENPMVALRGHLALILPDLAMHPIKLADIGLHEYRGEAGWVGWTGSDAARRVAIRWTPW
jgi:hypothetical protein